MKRCCTCHLLRPLSDYNVRRSSAGGRQSRCRQCSRAWYEKNAQQHKKNVRRTAAATAARHRERLAAYFQAHPCVDCGEVDLRCLEFDHREGETKTANIASLLKDRAPWSRIEAEIQKCDVRCASCHRRVTALRACSWRVAAEAERVGGTTAFSASRLARIFA